MPSFVQTVIIADTRSALIRIADRSTFQGPRPPTTFCSI